VSWKRLEIHRTEPVVHVDHARDEAPRTASWRESPPISPRRPEVLNTEVFSIRAKRSKRCTVIVTVGPSDGYVLPGICLTDQRPWRKYALYIECHFTVTFTFVCCFFLSRNAHHLATSTSIIASYLWQKWYEHYVLEFTLFAKFSSNILSYSLTRRIVLARIGVQGNL